MGSRVVTIIGAVISVLALIGTVIIYRGYNQTTSCSSDLLTSTKPLYDPFKLKNVASADAKTLIAFQGYLKYPASEFKQKLHKLLESGSQKAFLGRFKRACALIDKLLKADGLYLSLANIEQVELVDKQTVMLNFEAGSLRLTFEQVEGPNNMISTHLQRLQFKLNEEDQELACQATGTKINFISANHYECDVEQTYDCTRLVAKENSTLQEVKIIAELTISSIRLELEGNEEDHEAAKFSRPTQACHKKLVHTKTGASSYVVVE